jgi:hypothetical protein
MTLPSAALGLLMLCAAAVAHSQAQPSQVEQAIFSDAHFGAVKPPAQLRYRFEHRDVAQPAAAFDDTVTLQLRAAAAGRCCTVNGQFLSGERQMALPEIEDAVSNPVTMYFLEREVRELQRQTKGQAAHFRRRIRLALAEAGPPTALTIRYNGKDLPAREIVVSPFVNDPMRARFEPQAQRRYRFVLAAGVPGQVWRIEAELPGERSDVLALMENAP